MAMSRLEFWPSIALLVALAATPNLPCMEAADAVTTKRIEDCYDVDLISMLSRNPENGDGCDELYASYRYYNATETYVVVDVEIQDDCQCSIRVNDTGCGCEYDATERTVTLTDFIHSVFPQKEQTIELPPTVDQYFQLASCDAPPVWGIRGASSGTLPPPPLPEKGMCHINWHLGAVTKGYSNGCQEWRTQQGFFVSAYQTNPPWTYARVLKSGNSSCSSGAPPSCRIELTALDNQTLAEPIVCSDCTMDAIAGGEGGIVDLDCSNLPASIRLSLDPERRSWLLLEDTEEMCNHPRRWRPTLRVQEQDRLHPVLPQVLVMLRHAPLQVLRHPSKTKIHNPFVSPLPSLSLNNLSASLPAVLSLQW